MWMKCQLGLGRDTILQTTRWNYETGTKLLRNVKVRWGGGVKVGKVGWWWWWWWMSKLGRENVTTYIHGAEIQLIRTLFIPSLTYAASLSTSHPPPPPPFPSDAPSPTPLPSRPPPSPLTGPTASISAAIKLKRASSGYITLVKWILSVWLAQCKPVLSNADSVMPAAILLSRKAYSNFPKLLVH